MKEDLYDVRDLTIRLQKQSSLCFFGYAISRQKALGSHFASDVILFCLRLALSLLQNLNLQPVPYMGSTFFFVLHKDI